MASALYLLKIHGDHSGQHSEVNLHFIGDNLTVGNVFINAMDLIESFATGALADFLACVPTTYQVERLSAIAILPQGGVERTQEFQDGDMPGQAAGHAASNQLCPVIRLIPPTGTKSAGRFFMPCISEGDINANVPQAGWLSNINGFVNNIMPLAGTSSITWTVAVYSRKLNTYVAANAYDTSSIVGVQRRRARPY